MSEIEKDYSKEAVQRRFARRHRSAERDTGPLAWILDGGALALSGVSLWYLFRSGLPAQGVLVVLAMVSLLPILAFVAARYVKPVPTPLGWIWLALMGIALIVIGFGPGG